MTELERYARMLAGALNDAFDQAMIDADVVLHMGGATQYEREAYLETYKAELVAWRTKTFAEMFARFLRDGHTLQ